MTCAMDPVYRVLSNLEWTIFLLDATIIHIEPEEKIVNKNRRKYYHYKMRYGTKFTGLVCLKERK